MVSETDLKALNFLKSVLDFNKPITHISTSINIDTGHKQDDLVLILQGEHKSFVALDLQLKAIKRLIEHADFKFDIEDDPYIEEKYILSILDSVGYILQNYFHNEVNNKNIELVKLFIDNFIELKQYDNPIYKEILDKQDIEDN